jgi:hypothetical protein
MIGHGYQIEKAISRTAKTDTELKRDLSRLHQACRTVVDVLDADLSGSCQIEVILSDLWRGSQVPRLAEDLQSLSEGIAILLVMAAQNGAIKKRREPSDFQTKMLGRKREADRADQLRRRIVHSSPAGRFREARASPSPLPAGERPPQTFTLLRGAVANPFTPRGRSVSEPVVRNRSVI